MQELIKDTEICPHCGKRREEESAVGKAIGWNGSGVFYYCCGHKIKAVELNPYAEPPENCPECLLMAAFEKGNVL